MTAVESIKIGSTSCDYINREDWSNICKSWLNGNEYHHIVTLNPEMVMRAETDDRFRGSLAKADIRVPDGAGLIWARWYLRSRYWPLWPSLTAFLWQLVERITGVGAVMQLAELCADNNQSLYLLGGQRQAAKLLAQRLKKKYKNLQIAVSPEHKWEESGPDHVLSHLKKFQPAVVLAAYGAPKQTIWLAKQKGNLPSVRIGIGVGGAFDILSERLPRAPTWLQRINMEWLWRLYLEPSRWARIWQAVVKFPIMVSRQKKRLVL